MAIHYQPRILILGGGFAGLQTAQSLKGADAEVILIEQHNYHTFVPLLYQVATAQLEPHTVAYPIRNILRRFSFGDAAVRSPLMFWHSMAPTRLQVLRSRVRQVNLTTQSITTDQGSLDYDYLVIATGSKTRLADVPGVADHAWPLRTLEDAMALKHHLLTCFEAASLELDPERRQALLTLVIVGGGATGVEMAGALIELIRTAIAKDFPTLDTRQVQLILVQSGDRLLPDLPESLGDYTRRKLRRLGVEVYLQAQVTEVTEASVQLDQSQVIPACTTIWTAGLEAAIPETTTSLETTPKGKLPVRQTLQLVHHDRVYVLGDAAYLEQQGKPLTGVAPEALQAGVTAARNLKRQLRGKSPQPFRYSNKGRLAIIGCFSGVGQIAGVPLTGFLPWLLWLAVHWVYLPGLRSRLVVLITWLHGYLLGDRAVRQILSTELRKPSISFHSNTTELKTVNREPTVRG